MRDWRVGLVCAGVARAALVGALRAAGAEVAALPVLSLRAATEPGPLGARLQAAKAASAWLFVSPAAVRFAWRACPGLAFGRGTRVLAVGPGTRAALSRRGIAAHCPPIRHDSEGVLAMPELDAVAGTVVMVKAPGGRTTLSDGLRARGLEVDEIGVYRRAPSRWDCRHRDRVEALLAARPRALLLATSGEVLGALPGLAGPAFAPLAQLPLLVSSARLAAIAGSLGFRDVEIAAGTSPAALVDGALGVARSRLRQVPEPRR